MRATFDILEDILGRLRLAVAARGTAMRRFLLAAVSHELEPGASAAKRRKRFPILDSSEPGALRLTNAEIDELIT